MQQRQLIHEFIAGGAVHCPVAVQGFAGAEDLLDVDRQVPPRREQVNDAAAQFAAVTPRDRRGRRCGRYASRRPGLRDQLEDFAVGRFEHRRTFDAQTAEFVDVEEAPPVDVIRRGAPTGQAIALALEQLMQRVRSLPSVVES